MDCASVSDSGSSGPSGWRPDDAHEALEHKVDMLQMDIARHEAQLAELAATRHHFAEVHGELVKLRTNQEIAAADNLRALEHITERLAAIDARLAGPKPRRRK